MKPVPFKEHLQKLLRVTGDSMSTCLRALEGCPEMREHFEQQYLELRDMRFRLLCLKQDMR